MLANIPNPGNLDKRYLEMKSGFDKSTVFAKELYDTPLILLYNIH
jgi:hypothetical protein